MQVREASKYGRRPHKCMNTRRQGSLVAILETGCHSSKNIRYRSYFISCFTLFYWQPWRPFFFFFFLPLSLLPIHEQGWMNVWWSKQKAWSRVTFSCQENISIPPYFTRKILLNYQSPNERKQSTNRVSVGNPSFPSWVNSLKKARHHWVIFNKIIRKISTAIAQSEWCELFLFFPGVICSYGISIWDTGADKCFFLTWRKYRYFDPINPALTSLVYLPQVFRKVSWPLLLKDLSQFGYS